MKCVKSGKTKAGSQRWLCKNCKTSLTHKINNESKELQIFLDWLFGKESQSTMSGEGRSFRKNNKLLHGKARLMLCFIFKKAG